jgi:hypothetical protein
MSPPFRRVVVVSIRSNRGWGITQNSDKLDRTTWSRVTGE